MRVNLHVDTSFNPTIGKTEFQVIVYVHTDDNPMGSMTLYDSVDYAQQPDETMNLNLWATAILRGLAARMEETFVYVDQRPEAVLIKNVHENK